MRDPAMTLPEHHLGLKTVYELPDALARLDAAADALSTTPLGLMDLTAWAVNVEAAAEMTLVMPLLGGKPVAIPRSAAFLFVNPAHLDSLRGGAVASGEVVHQRGALRTSYFRARMASCPAATAAMFSTGEVV